MTKELTSVLIGAAVGGTVTGAAYAASKKAVGGNTTIGELTGATITGAFNGALSVCTVIGASKVIKDNFFVDEEIEFF